MFWLTSVAMGVRPTFRTIHKFGRNGGATANEDIWWTGGLMSWETSANVVSVTSSSGDDAAAGSGAQTLTIQGLDASWDEIEETVTLTGATPALTAASFIRVNRAFVASVGTYHGANAGVLTATINANTTFTIPIGIGQTLLARYSVPRNHQVWLWTVDVTVSAVQDYTVELLYNPNADDVATPFTGATRHQLLVDVLGGDSVSVRPKMLRGPYGEMSDLWWRCTAASGPASAVNVDFELLQHEGIV